MTSSSVSSSPPAETIPELIDIGAVAEILSVSTRHVERLSDSGRMPRPIALGRIRRWRRRDIMDWLDAGCPRVAPRAGGRAR